MPDRHFAGWPTFCSGVAVDAVRCERRQADGDVVGAVRRAVAHPLTGLGVHGLPRRRDERPAVVLDEYGAREHHSPLVEVRLLPGLGPPRRTRHVRDAHPRLAGVDDPDVLADGLRRCPCRLALGRSFTQRRHEPDRASRAPRSGQLVGRPGRSLSSTSFAHLCSGTSEPRCNVTSSRRTTGRGLTMCNARPRLRRWSAVCPRSMTVPTSRKVISSASMVTLRAVTIARYSAAFSSSRQDTSTVPPRWMRTSSSATTYSIEGPLGAQ